MSDTKYGGDRLAEGIAVSVAEIDPAALRWMTELSLTIKQANDLLAKAPPAMDARSVNLCRTQLETASLWLGNAVNILVTGVGAAHRKPEN